MPGSFGGDRAIPLAVGPGQRAQGRASLAVVRAVWPSGYRLPDFYHLLPRTAFVSGWQPAVSLGPSSSL
jgi:hypothetical protein